MRFGFGLGFRVGREGETALAGGAAAAQSEAAQAGHREERGEDHRLRDMGRYGEVWGDMGRYGEVWGDMGRYGQIASEMLRPSP